MAKNKISIDFSALDGIKKQLDALGGNATKQAVDAALQESQKLIADQVSAAMSAHDFTGKTKKSIVIGEPVEWTADTASVAVGFDITDGGLPSIFLMYGTKLHGQPHIKPDRNLYNAVYGPQTRKKILEIQKKAFNDTLQGVMNENSVN